MVLGCHELSHHHVPYFKDGMVTREGLWLVGWSCVAEGVLVGPLPSEPIVVNPPFMLEQSDIDFQVHAINKNEFHALSCRGGLQQSRKHPTHVRSKASCGDFLNLRKFEPFHELILRRTTQAMFW
jgi:hypothetical protein